MAPFGPTSLPPEIWLLILRRATAVTSLFDYSPPDDFSYSISRRPETIQRRILQSLRTKWALVLVCKLWYLLVRPLLYEALVIRRPAYLVKLLGIRISHRMCGPQGVGSGSQSMQWIACLDDNGKGGLNFLRWIRRLDIKLDFFDDGDDDLMPLLHLLMRGATNLEVVTMHLSCQSYQLTKSVLDFPLPIETRSLQVLDIMSKLPHPDSWVGKLRDIIPKQPLQCLRIELPKSDENTWCNYRLCLSGIRCLGVPNRMLTSLHLPGPNKLTHLIINNSFFTEHGCIEKLSLFGEMLIHLDIPNAALWTYGPDPPHRMTLMHSIAGWCPKLQGLVFSFRRDEVVHFRHLDYLPPVNHLGLRMDDGAELAPLVWSAVINDISKLLQTTPTIRVLRDLSKQRVLRQFKSPETRGYYEQASAIPRSCYRILEEFSVRVEDYSGHLICG